MTGGCLCVSLRDMGDPAAALKVTRGCLSAKSRRGTLGETQFEFVTTENHGNLSPNFLIVPDAIVDVDDDNDDGDDDEWVDDDEGAMTMTMGER